MSEKKCWLCQEDLTDSDSQCPHCGAPVEYSSVDSSDSGASEGVGDGDDEEMRRIDALEAGECPSCGADIGVWIDLGDTECPECGASI